MSGEVTAIILAAGESKRMEGPKLILPFGNSTIIGSVVENILSAGIENVIVVLGCWKEEVRQATAGMKINYCLNENFRNGMLSSVICGLKSTGDKAEAAMIIPGDQPGISSADIRALLSEREVSDQGIIVASHNGKRGHPLLIERKYFAEVEKLDANRGLKELMEKFANDIKELECSNQLVLKDIDTLEDYNETINKIF